MGMFWRTLSVRNRFSLAMSLEFIMGFLDTSTRISLYSSIKRLLSGCL